MAEKVLAYKIDVNTKTLNELEQDLAQINEELNEVKIGSDAFNDLTQKAQATSAALAKVNKQVEGFTLEQKIETSQGAVTALAGGLEATVGTLGLLGVESEAFGKLEEKALSAISAARGFIDIADGVGKVAKNIDFATVKAKIFGLTTKQALIATGIGAFVVALGSVVAYWSEITAGIEKFGQKVPAVGKAIDFIKTSFDKLIESVRPALEWLGIIPTLEEKAAEATRQAAEVKSQALDKELKLAQARGASQKELARLEEEYLKKKIAAAKEEEDIDAAKFELQLFYARQEKIRNDERQKAIDEAAAKKKAQDEKDKAQAEKDAEDAKKREEDRLKSIRDILNEYAKKFEDDAANTNLKKVELEEQRALAELDALKATEEEKLKIIQYYNGKKQEAKEQDDKETEEKNKEIAQKAYDALMKNIQDEYDAAQDKIAIRAMVVDAVAQIANEETAIGKAAFVAQQILRLQDLKSVATAALQKIAIDQAGAGADVAKGLAATLKAGFPQNVPLLIAYAAQAAAVVATTIKAFTKAKSAVNATGLASGGAGSNPSFSAPGVRGTAPQSSPVQAPETPVQNQCIKTYVLSGDVTSAQEADSKLNKKRSLG